MTSRLPASIPDTQLGLSPAEIILLRHHSALALAPTPHAAPAPPVLTTSSYYAAPTTTYATPTIASRGRGTSRSSAHSSSRASSSATSGAARSGTAAGRLVLEAGSLGVLAGHFERVMGGIGQRIDHLTAQTQGGAVAQSARAAGSVAGAEAEIARFRGLLQQIDELETEFDKVRNIRDIVAGYRRRVAGLGGGGGGRRR